MKILLSGDDASCLISPIVSELQSQGHQVIYLNNSYIADFKYFSVFERLANLISKKVYKTNLKKRRIELSIEKFLRGFCIDREFDVALILHPAFFSRTQLQLITKCSKRMVCYLWDSVDKVPASLNNIDLFDRILSFDPKDSQERGFIELTNYIPPDIKAISKDVEMSGDLFGVFSYGQERYEFAERLLKCNPEIKARIMIKSAHPKKRHKAKDSRIEFIAQPLVGAELNNISQHYKAILDVGHATQQGLSFRFFETLASEQKLITTNPGVKSYPFYNSENICSVSWQKPVIAAGFFERDCQPVSPEIKEYYQLENWVKRLVVLIS